MNYREELARLRGERDRVIAAAQVEHWAHVEAIRAETRQKIAEITAQRDDRIRHLASEGFGSTAIAAQVGCHQSTVREILRPDIRDRRRPRRREYWRARYGREAAAGTVRDPGPPRPGDREKGSSVLP